MFEFVPDLFNGLIIEYPDRFEVDLIIFDRVFLFPEPEQVLRYILGTTRFFVATHPERHALDKVGFLVFNTEFPHPFDRIVDREQVIAVDLDAFHAIAFGFIHQTDTTVLFIHRCTQPIPVIFNNKDHRQVPHSRHIQGFMKITLTGRPVTGEGEGHFVFLS